MLYSVNQIAKSLDISRNRVYRLVDKLQKNGINGIVLTEQLTEQQTQQRTEQQKNGFQGKYLINEIGYNYIKSCVDKVEYIPPQEPPKEPTSDKTDDITKKYIAFLENQIKVKDEQIESLNKLLNDNQILLGVEKSANLLSSNTDNQNDSDIITTDDIPSKKKISFIQRLFNRSL